MAAKLITPERGFHVGAVSASTKKPIPEKLRKVSPAVVSDTACRVGMICGLLMGVNEDACKKLEQQGIKNPLEFRYGRETQIVREAREKFIGKKPK